MRRSTSLILIALILLGSAPLAGSATADDLPTETAVFFVQWYGVGKSALEGLDGVKSVTSGFSGFREINTVVYDPTVIDRERLVSTLKAAGTYIGEKR